MLAAQKRKKKTIRKKEWDKEKLSSRKIEFEKLEGYQHHLRKSAHRKANQSGERNEGFRDFVLLEMQLFLRCLYPPSNLFFLFPIVFDINLIHFFDGRKDGATGHFIVCFDRIHCKTEDVPWPGHARWVCRTMAVSWPQQGTVESVFFCSKLCLKKLPTSASRIDFKLCMLTLLA